MEKKCGFKLKGKHDIMNLPLLFVVTQRHLIYLSCQWINGMSKWGWVVNFQVFVRKQSAGVIQVCLVGPGTGKSIPLFTE